MAKYCAHCGKQISEEALFCRYCGEKVGADDALYAYGNALKKPAKEVDTSSGNQIISKKKKIIAIIVMVIAFVSVVVCLGAFLFFGKPSGTADASKTEIEETNQEESENNQSQAIESKGGGTESKSANNSRYFVGETYIVQTNLRVREGPGKNYRILDRSELTPDDYSQSVDSATTTDALMEKGSIITCFEMSGNWMRISSGWVCVEDEGEVLVK